MYFNRNLYTVKSFLQHIQVGHMNVPCWPNKLLGLKVTSVWAVLRYTINNIQYSFIFCIKLAKFHRWDHTSTVWTASVFSNLRSYHRKWILILGVNGVFGPVPHSAAGPVESCCKGVGGVSAGCMEFCQASLYHAGMMLAGFPMEHEPVGKEIKPLLSPTSVLGGKGWDLCSGNRSY